MTRAAALALGAAFGRDGFAGQAAHQQCAPFRIWRIGAVGPRAVACRTCESEIFGVVTATQMARHQMLARCTGRIPHIARQAKLDPTPMAVLVACRKKRQQRRIIGVACHLRLPLASACMQG
ncbi:hypothetical protein TMPK1_12700 [Rhodospirillales bacterium TMPK1]|uniref:Uncharacterized protein n=1 Tax=Roseiterribacter gracilis TaxID=2812848 RepID=A0A8S8X798_9PROT|nr:hypothetical protein TMPK1_12700 [Rhodospirillales bacterium TMPK1]